MRVKNVNQNLFGDVTNIDIEYVIILEDSWSSIN